MRARRHGVAALLAAALGASAAAQAPVPAPAETVRVEQVEALKALLEKIENPDEATARALELVKAALDNLEIARRADAEAVKLAEVQAGAPAEIAAIRQELSVTPDTSISPPPDATLDQLRQLADQADASLAAARGELAKLDAEAATRDTRRTEIPRVREDLQVALEKLDAEPPGALASEPPALSDAKRFERQARRQALVSQLAALEKEQASDEARELLDLRRERWKARIATRAEIAQKWGDLLATEEQKQAEHESGLAREAAAKAAAREITAPELKEIADKNLLLASLRAGAHGVLARRDATRQERDRALAELQQLTDRFNRARERTEVASLTELGDVQIRRERHRLPDLSQLRRRVEQRRNEISQVQLQLADLEYEFETLQPAQVRKDAILKTMAADRAQKPAPELEVLLTTLLDEQPTRYRTLIDDTQKYLDAMLELQAVERRLIETAGAFKSYIDERVLWIRSMTPLRSGDADHVAQTVATITDPKGWRRAWEELRLAIKDNPADFGAPAVAAVIIPLLRRRLSRQLTEVGRRVRRRAVGDFSGTVAGAALTLAVAAAWPAVFWIIAWRLDAVEPPERLSAMTSAGLVRVASVLFVLGLLRELCRDDGLADAHYNTDPASRRALARTMGWLIPALLPCALIIGATEFGSGGVGSDPLGRVAFVVSSLLFALAVGRLLRPGGPLMANLLRRRRGGWLDNLRWVWYPATVAVPLSLGILALLGYYYSALQLSQRLAVTVWVATAVFVVNGAVTRWLAVVRWRLVSHEAQRAREQAQTDTSEAGTIALKSEQLDPHAVSAQARQMLRWCAALALAIGVGVIWYEMFPAFSGLDRIQLWPQVRMIGSSPAPPAPALVALSTAPTETRPPANGARVAPTPAPVTAMPGLAGGDPPADRAAAAGTVITLADLLLAVVFLTLTAVLGRNLPGLLEITVLNRLPLEPGARFAVAALARYAVVILGIILAFHAIGIGWSKVQWLAAAVTVGLGFGLQEIFANFVSGLIILFERPIRVGDTVTVGAVSGTVSRIRIRATTITDWDRRELIIPNKQLVTGELINWTLSDAITRVKIKVGIAYGSDTELARRIMYDAARASPYVRDDPEPQVRFVEFADSALNFEVRVFTSNIDHNVLVRDELNSAIDRAFREAGIEIPFPQRDLHIRSIAGSLAAPPTAVARPADGPSAQRPSAGAVPAPSSRPRAPELENGGDA